MKEKAPQNNNFFHLEKEAIFQQLRELEQSVESTPEEKRKWTDDILQKELRKEHIIKELEVVNDFLKSVEEGTAPQEDLVYADRAPNFIKEKETELRLLNQEIQNLEKKRDFNKERELNRLLDELSNIESPQ